MTDLGTLGNSSSNSYAFGINADGNVVGYSQLPGNNVDNAFYCDHTNLTMVSLYSLDGTDSRAFAINNNDQAVGWAEMNTSLGGNGIGFRSPYCPRRLSEAMGLHAHDGRRAAPSPYPCSCSSSQRSRRSRNWSLSVDILTPVLIVEHFRRF